MIRLRRKAPPLLIGVLFTAVGIGALAAAGWLGMQTREFVARAAHAQGEVTGLEASRSGSDSSPTYHPTVRFSAADGIEVTFRSSTGTNPPAHRVGDKVPVLYEPADPQHAEIDSFVDVWLAPLIVGFLGAVFTLIGLGVGAGGIRAALLRRRLRAEGQRIMAEVQGVESGSQASGPGYTIVAKATDPRGIERIFRSAPFPSDPGPSLQGRKTVDVIVDPDDYGTYEMDLPFIAK